MSIYSKLRRTIVSEGNVYKSSELFKILTEDFDARDFINAEEKIPHEYRLYDPVTPVNPQRDIKKLCERDLLNIIRGNNEDIISKDPEDLEVGVEISSVYCKLYNFYQHLESPEKKEVFIDNLSRVFWFIRPNINDNRVKFHSIMVAILSSENVFESIRTLSDRIRLSYNPEGSDEDVPEAQDIKNALNRLKGKENLTYKEINKVLNSTKYNSYALYEKSFEKGPFRRVNQIFNLKYRENLEEKSFKTLLDKAYKKIYQSSYVGGDDKLHFYQVIDNITEELLNSIIKSYNKNDAIKADLVAEEDIKTINGKTVIPTGGFVEVKMRDYSLDSYLSEYFSIYKEANIPPKYKTPEMIEVYNAVINSLFKKIKITNLSILTDIKSNFYGIFFGEKLYKGKLMPVFIPKKYIDIYWSNKGKIESNKQLRLSIRYKLNSDNINGYFYDRDNYTLTPFKFNGNTNNRQIFGESHIINKSILLEGRKEDARAKYEDIDDDVFDYYANNDPSGNQKYLDWMLNNVVGRYRGNLVPELMEMVKFFHQHQNMFIEKDINRHNLTTLDREIDDVKEKLLQKQKKKQAKKQSIRLYEDDRWLVISPKSWEASCYYGAGTKWCITMKDNPSYWNRYSKNASFFFIIDKTKQQDDPLYKVAYRKIGRRGKYELWNAPDHEISGSEDGITYFEELPEELKNKVEAQHIKDFPLDVKRSEWVNSSPRAQALFNGLDTEDVEDIEDYWYGMPIFQVDNEHYVVGSGEEMDEAVEQYYREYDDEDLIEYYDYDGYYLRMNDEEGYIDNEVSDYVSNLSDREKLEIAGLLDNETKIESKIEYLEGKLEETYDEEEIEEIVVLLDSLRNDLDGLVEKAEKIVSDSYREDWERCLSDGPKECFVDDHGWFRNSRELYHSGIVYLDRDGLIEHLTQNSDWDMFTPYGHEQMYDDEDNTWYAFKIDY